MSTDIFILKPYVRTCPIGFECNKPNLLMETCVNLPFLRFPYPSPSLLTLLRNLARYFYPHLWCCIRYLSGRVHCVSLGLWSQPPPRFGRHAEGSGVSLQVSELHLQDTVAPGEKVWSGEERKRKRGNWKESRGWRKKENMCWQVGL